MASGEMAPTAFRALLGESLSACCAVSKAGAVHFICMDWRHLSDVEAASAGLYDTLLNVCVWNKSNAGMGSLYRSKHEMVFVYRVPGAPHTNAVELGKHGRNRTNVWDYASVNSLRGSRREDLALAPTVKPLAMVADAFCDVTRQGSWCSIPFWAPARARSPRRGSLAASAGSTSIPRTSMWRSNAGRT